MNSTKQNTLTTQVETVVAHASPSEQQHGPGWRLYQTRRSARLSIEQVAQELRLSGQVIEAIEADNYGYFNHHTFLKGYIRSYAQLLGLPADDLVKAFNDLELTEPQTTKPKVGLAKHKAGLLRRSLWLWPWMLTIVAIALLTAGIAYKFWYQQQPVTQESAVEEATSSPTSTKKWAISTPLSSIKPSVSSAKAKKSQDE